ncbi:MAG: AbgT family transporter [Phycisphaerales bacterium]|nr:AbgT family transporter [Phycisphaerales bacterium]
MATTPAASSESNGGVLGLIEWLGNKLPDPVFLFLGATLIVMVLSAAGSAMGWSVQPHRPQVMLEIYTDESGSQARRPVKDKSGRPKVELVAEGRPISPTNLLSRDGLYWLVANMIRNFINFAPLGVVLVGMLGIGVAEKVGLFGAAMKWLALLVPSSLLTPTVVFLGVMSNMASDAGYIILPPLAAALYVVYGRPPLAGIAAAFAGVSAGFSANLVIAATDALVAGLTQTGARIIEPSYNVIATCNWFFMAASTFLLTFIGWAVTAWIVEPRLIKTGQGAIEVAASETDRRLAPEEVRGLRAALLGLVAILAVVGGLLFIPGAPLHGPMPAPAPNYGTIPVTPPAAPGRFTAAEGGAPEGGPITGIVEVPAGYTLESAGQDSAGRPVRGAARLTGPVTGEARLARPADPQPRWTVAIVPIIFAVFFVPGLAYGLVTGSIRSQGDVTKAFVYAMSSMAPVIAMAFFAAQFIECFRFSRLDAMLANAGGQTLVSLGLPPLLLLVAVVVLTMFINIMMSSMSAKWTALAPILVPMMMMVGISPELTQCAYRVGDSVTNIITPLNSYVIVVLVAVQRYSKSAGIGNLIALMLPYSVVFFIVWMAFLLLWVGAGVPIGPDAPLWYAPAHD